MQECLNNITRELTPDIFGVGSLYITVKLSVERRDLLRPHFPWQARLLAPCLYIYKFNPLKINIDLNYSYI